MSNTTTVNAKPRVTIVVVPRERFGMAQRSLESIYATAGIPFELIYIDARSPRKISEWLKAESAAKGFRVIHLDRFVNPNEARNIGLAASSTEYVVFSDNDVICADGWLSAAVRCADETGADVVQPLICGRSSHSFARAFYNRCLRRRQENLLFRWPSGSRLARCDDSTIGSRWRKCAALKREQTETCEFHCVLMRRTIFDRVGHFDEDMGGHEGPYRFFHLCCAGRRQDHVRTGFS